MGCRPRGHSKKGRGRQQWWRVALVTGAWRTWPVKGMLMLVYDIGDDVAFGLLTWLSQQHNIKRRAR